MEEVILFGLSRGHSWLLEELPAGDGHTKESRDSKGRMGNIMKGSVLRLINMRCILDVP